MNIIKTGIEYLPYIIPIALVLWEIGKQTKKLMDEKKGKKLHEAIFEASLEVGKQQYNKFLTNKDLQTKVINKVYEKFPQAQVIPIDQLKKTIEEVYKLQVKPELKANEIKGVDKT